MDHRVDVPPGSDRRAKCEGPLEVGQVSSRMNSRGTGLSRIPCCTSYDIPLQLVIHSGGVTHRFEGGLAIFDWHFADGGRRVVFSQQTVPFACSVIMIRPSLDAWMPKNWPPDCECVARSFVESGWMMTISP